MGRAASSWTRSDSIVVLASYMEKPERLMVPPLHERERLANLLRRPVAEVTARLWAFAALDTQNTATGEAGKREAALWDEFQDNRLELVLAADTIIEERKRVPHYLSN